MTRTFGYYSDHDLNIYNVRKQRLPKSKVKVIKSRSKKHFNQNEFLADVATTPWDTAFIFGGIVKLAPPDQCRDKESNAIEKQVVQNNIIATLLKTYGNTIVCKGT